MVILLLIIMNLILFGLPKGKMMITTVLLLYIKLTKHIPHHSVANKMLKLTMPQSMSMMLILPI